jgi:fructokinase
LTEATPEGRFISGGSAANSCAVAALLGARVAFLGTVAEDSLGHAFANDLAATGVHFPSAKLAGGAPTARCLIYVTPDGQRTMNTFLGACVAFGADDVDASLVADSAVLYLEGYLFDPPEAQAAFWSAAQRARHAGRRVALSLSDAFCVQRHRGLFLKLLGEVDVLFANETEICSLFECDNWEDAAQAAGAQVRVAALTRGAEGSVILNGGQRIDVPASPTTVVDTTGAGDAYAAGFLAALTAGRDLAACGRLGSLAAAEVISHFGARPLADLSGLLATV